MTQVANDTVFKTTREDFPEYLSLRLRQLKKSVERKIQLV